MSEYSRIESLFYDMTVQMRQFGNCAVKLQDCQQRIESSNMHIERFILSLSSSREILSFDKPVLHKEVVTQTPTISSEESPLQTSQSQSKLNSTVLSKSTSQKRQRETLFSLEKQKTNVPKKYQNAKDIATLERILQYIASKKKEGVLLKDVYVLINESTIKCNDYLNVLIKLEEIVKSQTKKGFVYTLHPVRYHKFLNSLVPCLNKF